ncbi:putative defensin-like protein 66 [Brassica rapa]|uniref:(rape) hypothetical protein n=1 Tax=Brassica napus TaxID=3708 RepID=A0A816Z638_BRANA|nr:putative defensin-like protein 66 [Brassica rapa]XP_022545332.2 putative defensin-like protein 66 [Brassica napus]CAF2192707.1 unnamed protein product [Brassica napus]
MGSFKLMVTFILVAMTTISCDFFNVETGIFVEAAAPKCGPDCTEKFLNQDCYKYCVELSYKNGVCVLSEGFPSKISTYWCCCLNF